jgi:DNA-binding PadR family transcriptional regulator
MEPGEGRWNRGIIFFIILTMAKDGPIYGNQVSNLISERTEGAWKPSAGSIYPALERLKRRGLIESYKEDGKVMYRITDKGSAFVSKIRERHFERSPISKFMGKLWMDVMGPEERTRFILNSAQHTADSLKENLENIRNGLGNPRQFEVFLMTYELELEKTLKILRDARKELTEIKEVR